jgi:sterol desaturase/sphingolipid hydroxylase (fatty acid hydroxylase superfamily)
MKPPVDPTLFAIPLFFALMAWEYRVIRRRREAGDTRLRGYSKPDSWASISMGIGSIFLVGALHLAVFALAVWLWRFRFFDLGGGWTGFLAAMLAWDFTFYWEHRFNHVVRFGWASHVNHHSSLRYNLSTALRQEWTPFIQLLMFPAWSLLGIRPAFMAIAGGLNLIYQYWIHTETIDRLPRWFEYVFNTPSHHRVHHGSNRQYLDKNYGGILIVWDRLFGTFEPEVEPVTYGLTKNIDSFNPFVIAFHEWIQMGREVRDAASPSEALHRIFDRPGWQPTPAVTEPTSQGRAPASH